MDLYNIWFDLRPGVKDVDLVDALQTFLGGLKEKGLIEGHRLTRRKLGFGPSELGEFHLTIEVRDLAQLQEVYDAVTPRVGQVEKDHAGVWGRVTNFRSGLWRDFPDANRVR